MAKSIVICSDGTGNTFDRRSSHVTRLVNCLAHDDGQVVLYDQGVGTAARAQAVPHDGVHHLDAPPGGAVTRVRGMLTGHGLARNVHEMYQALVTHYRPGDHVFLFGFSRGAFTVRALAGLLHRCGLPGTPVSDARFQEIWDLYVPIHPDAGQRVAIERLRDEGHGPCPVHFLGLWDTVKSYGGLVPVMLPHLRHNPDVAHVRHALALHERRAWFQPTTWGRLDRDRANAMLRLSRDDVARIEEQDVREVWFAGSHGDVGGSESSDAGWVSLRWMLAEAGRVTPRLRFKTRDDDLLGKDEPEGPLAVHRSWEWSWFLTGLVPRGEIDNGGLYPTRRPRWNPSGRRKPHDLLRNGRVHVHVTALRTVKIQAPVEEVRTELPGPAMHA